MNSAAGAEENRAIREQIVSSLMQLVRNVVLVEVQPGDDLLQLAQQLVQQAAQEGGIVAAAGGDGTVNTLASFCCRYQVPLGIIPIGTFNYFARTWDIPLDIRSACEVLVTGVRRAVNVGYVNQHIFLNNASFGLYSQIIRQREKDKARFGRYRLVAVLSAIGSLLSSRLRFALKINGQDSRQEVRRTSMVFICNNTFQLGKLDQSWCDCVRQGKLAVVLLKPVSRLTMASLLLHSLLKNLNNERHLEFFCADSLIMETKRRVLNVVTDGELVQCQAPLSFRLARQALTIMVPPAASQP